MVQRDDRVLPGLLEFADSLGARVQLVHRASQARQYRLVPPVLQVLRVLQVQRVRQEHRVFQVQQYRLVQQVIRDQQVVLV